MRIAVSGTHGTGKSTLIDAFLLRHQHFANEPEPYLVLQELYGEAFAENPTFEDFHRQLEFNIETLRRYRFGDQVIFERSPFDFLAYMFVLADRDHPKRRQRDLEESLITVRAAVSLLDAVIFLPLAGSAGIVVPESEDLRLREAVDEHLHEILLADEFDFFMSHSPVIVEATGTLEQRLLALERMLE